MDSKVNFDAPGLARRLLRCSSQGALATLMTDTGAPYCSLVNVASAFDGAPLILVSRLAIHTKNIAADARVSLMLDERRAGDPLEGSRIMLGGVASITTDALARQRYLARHPSAAQYIDFPDFSLMRIEPSGLHLVAGFGRITDLAPHDFLIDVSDTKPLAEAEPGAVQHMNEDHRDTLSLYAVRLLGRSEGPWRCVACDPEGMDMQNGNETVRLAFSERISSSAALRKVLKELAEKARSIAP
jgi:putative heme iron utilization protein